MKKIKMLFLSLFCFCCISKTAAQSDIVLKGYDNKGDELNEYEWQAIAAVKNPVCKMPTKSLAIKHYGLVYSDEYDSLGFLVSRDTVLRKDQSWQYFGQSFIANALYSLKSYRHDDGLDSGVCVGYVLDFGALNSDFSNSYSWTKTENNPTKNTIKTILKDKSYHEGIYQWLKPALILAWICLGEEFHSFYRGLIYYVRTFDYENEKKYYKGLKINNKEYLFTSYEPNLRDDPRRKAKAWVFRRMYFDGWDFAYVLKWINRIEKEIMI